MTEDDGLTVDRQPDAVAAAHRAAAVAAGRLRDAVAERGQATLALSGGRSPAVMVAALADCDVPWGSVHLFQVDERVVPADHPDRNWRGLAPLVACLPGGNVHPMPVELGHADLAYAEELRRRAGRSPVLDVIHLGLGTDGHTASLVPGDPALDVVDRPVAFTGEYLGHRRLTLTFPVLNRARQVVWLATGAEKALVVRRLLAADPELVATRVERTRALLVTDVELGQRGPSRSTA